jgi:hypothetical protein
MALICILGLPLVFAPFESHVSSYSFDSFKREPMLVIPFHASSYSFDSFKEIGWLSSHHHIFHSSPIESMFPSHSLCLHMFKGIQPLHFHPYLSSPSFDPSLFIAILICFMSLMGDASWPSFDESIPFEFNTSFGN